MTSLTAADLFGFRNKFSLFALAKAISGWRPIRHQLGAGALGSPKRLVGAGSRVELWRACFQGHEKLPKNVPI
jgi:hypothetical protein